MLGLTFLWLSLETDLLLLAMEVSSMPLQDSCHKGKGSWAEPRMGLLRSPGHFLGPFCSMS